MKHYLVIILFLVFVSCKKKYTPVTIDCTLSKDTNLLRTLLPGTWVWLEEKRAVRGVSNYVYLTPNTEGYTLKMKLNNDTAFFTKNDKADSVYRYSIVKLGVISGTSFPEDEDPVLVFYSLKTGIRRYHVPILACNNFLVKQFNYVSSVKGNETWKKE